MGGEPTFVSVDDLESAERNVAAVGPTKQALADELIRKLHARFAPGGLLHYGQGKWYPGESLPRWAFGLYWRKDGVPIWKNADLIAKIENPRKAESKTPRLSWKAPRSGSVWMPAMSCRPMKIPYTGCRRKRHFRSMSIPANSKLADAEERSRMARVFDEGLEQTQRLCAADPARGRRRLGLDERTLAAQPRPSVPDTG